MDRALADRARHADVFAGRDWPVNEPWVTTKSKPPPGRDMPGPALPLGYADPVMNRDDSQRVRDGWVEWLGGWRRIVFSIGLALFTGGLTYCMWPRSSEAVFWVGLGALLIGMTVRWPLRD